MKKISLMMMLLVCMGLSALAQTREITGTVTSSEDGLTIPGVQILVVGTTIGTSTDAEGKYSIVVPANAKSLRFVYIGMKTVEVPIEDKSIIDVVMEEDVLRLDEVVVVGYGTAKQVGTVVGSLTKVNEETIKDKPSPNVFDALQGKVAGVQTFSSSGEPTEISSVRLHGVGSLGASSTPLYVIDGTPISEASMLALNSNDFADVTILKDASATSIYGSRAANGVVYITTKSGKRRQDARITVNTQYGVSNIANPDFYQNFMNTAELTGLWLETGFRTQAQVDALLDAFPNDTEWYKYYYKSNAPTMQTNVSITGGNERTSYYVSGGYFNQEGLATRSKYERYSMRANVNSKVKDWLSFGVNLAGSSDDRQANPFGRNSTNRGLAMLAQPFYSPYDENGDRYDGVIPGWGRYDPYYLEEKQPANNERVQFNGSGFIQLNPMPGLVIRTQAGIDAFDNRYHQKRYPSFIGSLNDGEVIESYTQEVTKTITNTIEYKLNIQNKHAFTFLLGQEGIDNDRDFFRAESSGQTDDRLVLLTAGPNNRDVDNAMTEYAYLSYFGRLDYNYAKKYFFDFSLRQDASSRFGTNNREAMFYAVGAMWDAKREQFLENLTWLSSFNLKASIGTSGNSAIGNYSHLALVGTSQFDGNTGWGISSPGNPDLSWEEQTKATVGTRFSLLDEKYRFNVEYYHRTTRNQLINVPYPFTSGFNTVLTNVGAIRNTGIDFEFNFDVIRRKDLAVTPYVNFNFNKNEITELFQGKDHWIIPNTGVCWAVGKPVSFFWPMFAGIDPADGAPQWYVPGEDITETSKETTTKTFNSTALEQSTGVPRYTPMAGGFGLNASYKGFSMQMDFTYAINKYMINNDRYFYENANQFTGFNMSKDVLDYWKQPGDEATFPGWNVARFMEFDDRLIEDASFMRLKNLSLSYTLPKNVLSRTGFISSARIFVTGRNLLTWTKFKGPDPEVDSNLTLGANPNTKQYTFGVEVSF